MAGLLFVLRDIAAPVDECFFCQQGLVAIHSSSSHHSLTSRSMECIAWIVLLIMASTSDGLSCINPKGEWQDFSSADVGSDDFFGKLKVLPMSSDIRGGVCRVKIYFDYAKDKLTIEFTKDLNDSTLHSGNVRFDTLMVPKHNGMFYVQNYLEYACSEGGCEMAFLRDHLPWLLNAKYPTLMEKASLLLTRGTGGASKNFTQLLGEFCLHLDRGYIN